MTDHEALLNPQELAAETALVEPRKRRAPALALWFVSLAVIAAVGTTAAPYLRPAMSEKMRSSSTQDLVRLAEAAPEDAKSEQPSADPKSPKVTAADKAAAAANEAAQLKKKAEAAAAALKNAEQEEEQAGSFKKHADDLQKDAEGVKAKADGREKDAAKTKDVATKDRKGAKDARSRAEELRDQAEKLQKQAAGLDDKAQGLDQDASAKDSDAAKTKQEAGRLAQQAASLKSESKSERQNAVDAETKALGDTANQRMCIDLPGVMLEGTNPQPFAPVVGNHSIHDDVNCKLWCLKHEKCRQSVWDWKTYQCQLFEEASTQPKAFKDFWPWFNSSYCGLVSEQEQMLDMLHKVYDMKPWVTPPHNCSWGQDNCIETNCCADHCRADAMFEKCEAFTCWKRDEYWAGCAVGDHEFGWDGTRLGGHANYEIAPTAEGKLVQGVRLYCFTVVMWYAGPGEGWMDSEAEMANHWKEQGKGIMQCDDYSMFDGLDGGSVHNIQSFIRAWNMVKDDGRWENNDWSIKVDPDAVFFPDHFRKKVQWVYRTPQGQAVYMRNTFYKFQFLGALEVLTREAVAVYFEKGWQCEANLGQEGGEDYWLLQCLEGIGVDYQTDVGLLHDKYASDENCGDPNSVGHHFFKKIVDWDVCWDMANNAWNNEHPE